MNIETVNELIRSLESAGELSIKELKYLELAKAYLDVAAENVQIKAMNDCLSEELRGYESDGAFEGPKMHLLWWQVETPVTDAYLAGIKVDAQSEVIEWLDAEITAIDTMYRGDPSYERDAYWMKSEVLDVVELARKAFPAQLREGADK